MNHTLTLTETHKRGNLHSDVSISVWHQVLQCVRGNQLGSDCLITFVFCVSTAVEKDLALDMDLRKLIGRGIQSIRINFPDLSECCSNH